MMIDMPYRIALALLLAACVLILVPFRVRASRGGEKISHRDEGFLFAAVLRVAGLVFWLFVFAFLFTPASVDRTALPLPAGIRWAALALGVLGLRLSNGLSHTWDTI
jgi:hypothetical protein